MNIDHRTAPKSKYFNLEKITDGVFIVLSIPRSGSFGNAGIVDLGDRTLIYDTFESPIIAEDLRVASEFLTGRSATWVVNSHFHPDHWFGNQVFPIETFIISSHNARENMLTAIDEIEEEKANPSEVEEYLLELKDQVSSETDPIIRGKIESSVARWELYQKSLPNFQLRIPDQAFNGTIELHGSNRYVELIDVGHAHTSGDLYLRIPSEKIAIIGDIGFFNEQPYMPDSNPEGWKSALTILKDSECDTYVPGHGPVGTDIDLALIEEYINLLETLVSNAIEKGETINDIIAQELPEPFRTWSIGSPRLEANCNFMFEYLSKGK